MDVLYGFFSYCVIVVVDYCDFFDVVEEFSDGRFAGFDVLDFFCGEFDE